LMVLEFKKKATMKIIEAQIERNFQSLFKEKKVDFLDVEFSCLLDFC
jgi:hypothetical protein